MSAAISRPSDSPTETNWTGVLFGFAIAAMAAFQQFKLPPTLLDLLTLYGYDRVFAGGLMSVYAVIGLLASLGLATAMVRFGPPRVLTGAMIFLFFGNMLGLAAPVSATAIMAGRALEGVGFAILAILGPVYANRNAAPHHLPLAIALTAIWILVGQLSASALAPLAHALGDWRLVWPISLVVVLIFGAWAQSIHRHRRFDLVAGIGQVAAAPISAAERWRLSVAAIIFLLWSTQYFAYMTWLPQFLIEVHGLGHTAAILGYALPVVLLIGFSLLTARGLRAGLPLAPLLAGALVLQAGIWLTMGWIDSALGGFASLVLYGVGIGVTPVCLFGMPAAILGPMRSGPKAFAILMTGRNCGVLIGPILLPQLIALTGDVDQRLRFSAPARRPRFPPAVWPWPCASRRPKRRGGSRQARSPTAWRPPDRPRFSDAVDRYEGLKVWVVTAAA